MATFILKATMHGVDQKLSQSKFDSMEAAVAAAHVKANRIQGTQSFSEVAGVWTMAACGYVFIIEMTK